MEKFEEGKFVSLYDIKRKNGNMTIKLVEYRENVNNKKEYAIKAISLRTNQTDKEKETDKAEDEHAKNKLFMHHNRS